MEWPHTLTTVSGQHTRPAQHNRQIRQSTRTVKFWRKSQDTEIKYFENFTSQHWQETQLLGLFDMVCVQQQEMELLVRVKGSKLHICLGQQKTSAGIDSTHYIIVHYKAITIKAIIISSLCHISHSKSDLILVHKPYNWTRARTEMCHTEKPLFDSHKLPWLNVCLYPDRQETGID
jgi:hypothetical protein